MPNASIPNPSNAQKSFIDLMVPRGVSTASQVWAPGIKVLSRRSIRRMGATGSWLPWGGVLHGQRATSNHDMGILR